MNKSCQHFPTCGGCQILDLPYAEQLAAKEEELKRHFIPWPDLTISAMLPSPEIFGYRHKVQLPFGLESRGLEWKEMKRSKLDASAPSILATVGCYAAGSHFVVDQAECLVQNPSLSNAAWALREWANAHSLPVYREENGEGWLRHLLLRRGAGTGEILLGLVTNGPGPLTEELILDLVRRVKTAFLEKPNNSAESDKSDKPDISDKSDEFVGLVQILKTERNNVVLGGEEKLLWGRDYLKEILGKYKFTVGISTFFQVNPYQTPRLYDLATAAIEPHSSVLDLYSGIGSIALWAAQHAKFVLGIEENSVAVEAARLAAKENGISNAIFQTGDVGEILLKISQSEKAGGEGNGQTNEKKYDIAIVDPPRKGLEATVRNSLIALGLEKIIYVSCFPPTLARDALAMADSYTLKSLAPVDMFPHTRHIECVAVFERKK